MDETANTRKVTTGRISGREGRIHALPSSLTSLGPLGEEANGQCVPVRGVRSDLVAGDRPESKELNRWWPDTLRRQTPLSGSRSGYCVSRCLRSGRSHTVLYRDPGRPCIVPLGQDIKRPNADPDPSGRVGIRRTKAEPMRCKESDGLIVAMTPCESREEASLSFERPGGEPKAIHLRRGPGLVGAEVMCEIGQSVRGIGRCKVC